MKMLRIVKSDWTTTAVEYDDEDDKSVVSAQPLDAGQLSRFLGDRWEFVRSEKQEDRTVSIYRRMGK